MKFKVIKKILSSLVLVATISTICGNVSALPEFPEKYVQDFVKTLQEDFDNRFKFNEARYVTGQIRDMAEKHLLKGFSSDQTLWFIGILDFCSKHTIDDEIKAQEEKYGCFSNISYIIANDRGFSEGDIARSNAQEAIKEMVGDGLFDGFNPDQILAVAKVLNSCLKSEVSDSKSDMPVADSIKLMAQRKLFDSLTESQIKVILDILHKCATDGCVAKCSVKPAVKSILESKAKCLTPEVESICEDILRKCKDGCDTLGYQGYYWKGKSVFNPYFDCQP